MTTKFPSCLILMEMAEELSSKRCDMQLTRIRRDRNQLADDLTNEKFDSFDAKFRIPLKGEELRWHVLDKLLSHADGYYSELLSKKATRGRGSFSEIWEIPKAKSLVTGNLKWLRVGAGLLKAGDCSRDRLGFRRTDKK